ncbi:hypothetical protein PR202_ga26537 [Eleusine coracana subsp. coracana]|uniref:Major facilitator superfamily (MFS) profile domain-containing protein n=1 Tax=Eleusine coracana subsp. coracana TaxID=191504 RepID=A0AAV5DDL5_ELECO|nr:hypothetical protein QOZ80_3AG0239390 [Eleusine coracana subsp. coracana]GJN08598.1 hypothetical protein PR202_ga26537 [Eleusine coracana subsp. coracana]
MWSCSSSAGRRRQWTLALVSLAALLEKADEALLPAVYNEAACYPLATCAAARHDRASVVAAGAFLWAVATLLVGASGTILQMAIARGFNGVVLALVVPAIYSLVADYSDDATRGSAFGWVLMAQSMGPVVGGSLGILLAPTTFLGVIPGWRLAFYVVALISFSLAALTWLLAADPRPIDITKTKALTTTLSEIVREAKDVVRVPTFLIIVAQGVAGSLPWSALNFAAMWLELVGFTHWATTVVTALNHLANALGALFAGFVGDPLARRFPNKGRVAMAQVCTASTVPLAAILLLALADDPAAGLAYAAAFFVFGFVTPWCPVATNNPIFAEIVPEKARTTVYALDRCFESVFASFGPTIVGILAERVFGYQPAASGESVEADRENAAALGKAIFAEIAVPITVCCLTYSALYWTYPADRQRAQTMAALHTASEEQDGDCEACLPAIATAADGLNQALLTRTE